jgi:perosamine synthetase
MELMTKKDFNMFVPVNTPKFSGNEKKYLIDCIDSGWISSEGPYVRKFEENFAKFCDRKYAVAVTNGTIAIDIALKALDLPRGSEVILPSFTIISCIHEIVNSGLKPVYVDSSLETWNMDVNQIEEKITPNTSAIMAVHIYSFPVEMDKVISLAKKYNLKIIEDAAEMHGQTYNGNICGSFGDISTFSFYANKHITTGEGGMILTNNKDYYEKILSLRNLCFTKEKRFYHTHLGTNARMTNIQAALGVAQLENINAIVKRKREIGELYNNLLVKNDKFITLPSKMPYADNIYWVYGILLKDSSNMTRIIEFLNKNGVGNRPFFYPLHKQPVLKEFNNNLSLPNSEILSENGFYIPSGLGITDKEIEYVSQKVNEILNQI